MIRSIQYSVHFDTDKKIKVIYVDKSQDVDIYKLITEHIEDAALLIVDFGTPKDLLFQACYQLCKSSMGQIKGFTIAPELTTDERNQMIAELTKRNELKYDTKTAQELWAEYVLKQDRDIVQEYEYVFDIKL